MYPLYSLYAGALPQYYKYPSSMSCICEAALCITSTSAWKYWGLGTLVVTSLMMSLNSLSFFYSMRRVCSKTQRCLVDSFDSLIFTSNFLILPEENFYKF